MKKKNKDNKKLFLRVLLYSGFFLGLVEAIIDSFKDTTLYLSVKIFIFLFSLILLVIIAEIFVWIIYKLLLMINYYGIKKPHNYQKDIKRFVIILVLLKLKLSDLIKLRFVIILVLLKLKLSDLINFEIIPPSKFEGISWLLNILGVIIYISLFGLYMLKKWGLYLYIFGNLVYGVALLIYGFQGVSDIATAIITLSLLIYYPYVRRSVLK